MRAGADARGNGALLGARTRGRGREGAPPGVPRAPSRNPRGGPADPVDGRAREAPDGFRRRVSAGRGADREHVAAGVPHARGARRPRAARRALLRRRGRKLFSRHLGHESRRRHSVRRALVRRHARPLLPEGPPRGRGRRGAPAHVGGMARYSAEAESTRGRRPLGHPPSDGRVGAARDPGPPERSRPPHGGRRRRGLPVTGVPRGGRVLRGPLPRRARSSPREHAGRERLSAVRRGRLRDVRHGAVEPRRVPAPRTRRARAG